METFAHVRIAFYRTKIQRHVTGVVQERQLKCVEVAVQYHFTIHGVSINILIK